LLATRRKARWATRLAALGGGGVALAREAQLIRVTRLLLLLQLQLLLLLLLLLHRRVALLHRWVALRLLYNEAGLVALRVAVVSVRRVGRQRRRARKVARSRRGACAEAQAAGGVGGRGRVARLLKGRKA